MEVFFNKVVWGNTIEDYGIALGVFTGLVLCVKIFSTVILGRAKKWSDSTGTDIDDFVIAGVKRFIVPVLYGFSLYYVLTSFLKLQAGVQKLLYSAFIVLLTVFAIRLITSIVRFAIRAYWERKGESETEEDSRNIQGVASMVNIVVWGVGVLFLLDNLGFEISSVIAGLGIGGIAVALASQAILGDLFSYFVIFFDRPFRVGDFIIVDTKMGVVEKVGIKTTRIRSLTGEQLVFSNKDLTNSRIHNYKKMEQRRVEFHFGVVYSTEYDTLKSIGTIVRGIIESVDGTTFDRAHFKEYGDFSLVYEVVYYIQSADYNRYMDVQEQINLAIFETFQKKGIEFAFPTQTLLVRREAE